MAAKSVEGLAALCLVANGFKAEGFAEERMRDGRISSISSQFDNGQFVVYVFSGPCEYFARGASKLDEADARAHALQAFWCWELEQAAQRPGELVTLDTAAFS